MCLAQTGYTGYCSPEHVRLCAHCLVWISASDWGNDVADGIFFHFPVFPDVEGDIDIIFHDYLWAEENWAVWDGE